MCSKGGITVKSDPAAMARVTPAAALPSSTGFQRPRAGAFHVGDVPVRRGGHARSGVFNEAAATK